MVVCKNNRWVLGLAFISVICSIAAPSLADADIEALRRTSKAFTEVAKKAIPAVVSVQTEVIITTGSGQRSRSFEEEFFEQFFGIRPKRRAPRHHVQVGQGSGFIVSADGYILTNNHVVGNADKITVTLNDGRSFNARIVGGDPKTDVAVIKIDSDNLPMVELGDSDKLEIGEWVMAVGNPFGLTETVTVGVVSAKGRSGFGVTGERGYEDFIQTDAAINPGNSGGPLLNLDGEVVGINTFIFSQSGGYMGIGFAVPVNMAKSIKNQLIKTGQFVRGYLGVYMDDLTPAMADFFDIKVTRGVIIAKVEDNSPAQKSGLKDRDIVLEIDGRKIKDASSLRNIIASQEPDTKIAMKIIRKGKEQTKAVTIGRRFQTVLASGASEISEQLGLGVREMTRDIARKLGYSNTEGVLVVDVARGTVADREGIEPGMVIVNVNHKPISSVEDLNEALEEMRKTKKALLLVKYGHQIEYFLLSLD